MTIRLLGGLLSAYDLSGEPVLRKFKLITFCENFGAQIQNFENFRDPRSCSSRRRIWGTA